jgi:uncharacterized protein YkwD
MSCDNHSRPYPKRHKRKVPSRFPICFIVLAALFLPALAPVCHAQMASMKLLTSTTGWVSRFGHLYSTTNRATPKAVPARPDPRQTSGADRMASLAKQMWVLVNRDRQDPANAAETHGRARPLKWNEKLAAVALAHSRDMGRRRYFAHVDREGRTPTDRIDATGIHWRALAENIALNQTVTDAEKDLMDEPRFQQNHRGNILNPEYTDVGIGIVQAPNGDLYITQDFAAIPRGHSAVRSGH